uniref:Formylglycine-generating enzyme, required for sulfatase activity, contains SUMF1/FGE domain n=1 Tax=Candidatus Kentrum sp. LFY TaxID=2126342 RepID=A0A450UEH7_9GAMM|nr:MAG: Formylglycine-generating enzyme, required for sulfatase activity, contains SUMF1/FGE domain [Candidatus Kentron sp. LFY]
MSEVTFISSKWLSPLLKKLIPLDRKRSVGLRGKIAQELDALSDTFGPVLDLVSCYVEPFCQDHSPTDDPKDRRPISHIRAPVFSTINTFLKGDSSRFTDSSRRMFVLSDPGMGKTSLLMMIKLTHLAGFWPQGYDCLLLKLGKDTLDVVWQHSDKTNTVLLLDALDEDPLALGNVEKRLLEILEAAGDYYRVIVSCRTRSLFSAATYPSDYPGEIRIGDHACLLAFLNTFDYEQVVDYLTKRFPHHLCDILVHCSDSLRREARHLVDEMGAQCFSPLLLAHIDDIMAVWLRKSDPYSLYLALFHGWIAREEARLYKLRRKKLGNPLDRRDLWTLFTTIAVFLQRRGEHSLSRAALYQLENDFSPPVANLDSLAYFDTGDRSLLNRNTAGDFRFIHCSIQEFLVAHSILIGQTDIIGDAIPVTDQILMFLKAANVMDLDLPKRLNSTQPLTPTPGFHFYDRMKDGSRGPAMQPIPAGEFLMGSPEGEGDKNEHPQHRVRIMAPFALGTWPVTFEEYDIFCTATGRKKPHDQGWGRKRHPVINVSWQDALDYCAWLSEKTGHHYRLPSEAEWEYAARAGTRTRYWWGDEFDDGSSGAHRANCDVDGSVSDVRQTSLVGSFPPNPFGLYDTAGNVREWTADCWHDNYQNAPSDGSIWMKEDLGDCGQRVVRGGSWNNGPQELRSASRGRYYTSDVTYTLLGFRLAREL